jgi:hypothetical protein
VVAIDKNDKYAKLKIALAGAVDQSENGKGKERHADGERFEHQKICVIGRWLRTSPVAGPLQQAVKKLVESSRFTPERAIHEIQGAINYAAAAIILLQEIVDDDTLGDVS